MLAGAVVATAIQRPLIVFPAVIASHFVLDVLPHFGVREESPSERNKHPLFRYILVIDLFLTAGLLLLLPLILQGTVSWWVLVLGMFLAWAPDLMWVREFFQVVKKHEHQQAPGWVMKFHQKIQWFEKPWGLITEVIFFGGMAVLLGVLAK